MNRQNAAESLGTMLLVASIVGSGIMGERLANGNAAIALLANSLATGAALLALIATFSSVSGAHFNPLVTLAAVSRKELPLTAALVRSAFQIVGAVAGAALANLMFDLPALFPSQHVRSGPGLWLGEMLATFGLILVVRMSGSLVAVPAYIVGAYWFTSSTSFANPAVTIARTMTDTFSGIRPIDAPAFVAAQVLGCLAATWVSRWLRAEK